MPIYQKKIRIILADDHMLVRAGVRSLLEDLPDVEVIGEADNGCQVLQLIEEDQPDIVLMDIAMSEMNGLEATSRIGTSFPAVRVIILSMHSTEEYIMQSLHAGAAGYLLKEAAPVELEIAIQAVDRGEIYLSPAVSKHLVDFIQRSGDGISPLEKLTPRQRQILQLLAEGHSNQEIAQRLTISAKTVKAHRMQLMERLDIYDTAGLVRFAIRSGMVGLGD